MKGQSHEGHYHFQTPKDSGHFRSLRILGVQNANTLCAQLNWDATDDVKEVAKQMEKEEVVAQEEEQHYHRGR